LGINGSCRYASINAHSGCQTSRRDDLESLGYMLIYFLQGGKLPWMGAKEEQVEEKFQTVLNLKKNTTLQELTKGCPNPFLAYMEYVRNLRFDERPDYNYLRSKKLSRIVHRSGGS
jgi:serine/threonine protein kinase